jgi:hypothetical protein
MKKEILIYNGYQDSHVIDDIDLYEPNIILFFCALETTFPFPHNAKNLIEQKSIRKLFEKKVHDKKIKVFVILGSEGELKNFDDIFVSDYIEYLYWPTFLLHYTFYITENQFIIEKKEKLNKLFSFYNMRPRYHRSMFIDFVYKNNLFKFGNITWNVLTKDHPTKKYDFKFWNETILHVKNNTYLHYDLNFFNDDSLFHIIGETDRNKNFITEKTYKTILIGKPFIVVGAKNSNLNLKKYGFKLYDELFDYSFDKEDNLEKRINGIIKNIINLKNKDYDNLLLTIKDKIEFNKKQYFKILEKDDYIPKTFLKLYSKYENYFEEKINKEVFSNIIKIILNKKLNKLI